MTTLTAAQMMKYIQSQCENGSTVTIGQDFIAQGGRKLWSMRGAGVDASGYLSLTEAFIKWREAVEFLNSDEYARRAS